MNVLNNTPPPPPVQNPPALPVAPPPPPLMPAAGDPQFDEKARIFEAWQRERLIAAHNRGADAAKALTDDSRLLQAQRRDEVLRLVSTMTSEQRKKPAQAVAAALALIAAVDAALAGQ